LATSFATPSRIVRRAPFVADCNSEQYDSSRWNNVIDTSRNGAADVRLLLTHTKPKEVSRTKAAPPLCIHCAGRTLAGESATKKPSPGGDADDDDDDDDDGSDDDGNGDGEEGGASI